MRNLGIALLPIVMIWWGTTEKTVFAVIVYTCFFPIAFTVLTGVRSTPVIYNERALRTLGAGHVRIVRDVLLPGAMPGIATGTNSAVMTEATACGTAVTDRSPTRMKLMPH